MRGWPELVHEVARNEVDPDRWIVAMLGARETLRGKTAAKTAATKTETQQTAQVRWRAQQDSNLRPSA